MSADAVEKDVVVVHSGKSKEHGVRFSEETEVMSKKKRYQRNTKQLFFLLWEIFFFVLIFHGFDIVVVVCTFFHAKTLTKLTQFGIYCPLC